MIVLSIIGILAAIALPAYQVYVAKTKVISLISTAAAGLPAFSEFYANNGHVPLDGNGPSGISTTGSETESFWNALNNTDFHSHIAYDRTDTQGWRSSMCQICATGLPTPAELGYLANAATYSALRSL
jgi:type IV pilus assembly protein PilA